MSKVGDRVWSFIHNSFMWVSQINGDYGCHLASDEKLLINYSHKYEEFHQTADDMFEELGYEKTSENLEVGHAIYCKGIHALTFDNISFKEPFTYIYHGQVTPQLHLAIHQKMIELGWLE